MGSTLVKLPIYEAKESDIILHPLLEGKPVTISVQDPKMRVKKRVQAPVLLIAPLTTYRINSHDLVFSLPGYGCEVVTPEHIEPLQLYRLGLTMRASKILSNTINELFREQRMKTKR